MIYVITTKYYKNPIWISSSWRDVRYWLRNSSTYRVVKFKHKRYPRRDFRYSMSDPLYREIKDYLSKYKSTGQRPTK